MLNKSIVIGRLTAKPTFDTSATGTSFSRFTIAANRPTSDNQADFIPCVAFRKTAELANQYLDKGSLVAVEGRINSSTYQNNEGKNITRIELVIDRLTFLETKNARSKGNTQSYNKPSNNYDNAKSNDSSSNDDFDDMDFVFE